MAAKRLLERAVARLGRRFADYLVVDGLYSGAPFLHLADRLGLPVIAVLKDNLPELMQAARRRFRPTTGSTMRRTATAYSPLQGPGSEIAGGPLMSLTPHWMAGYHEM